VPVPQVPAPLVEGGAVTRLSWAEALLVIGYLLALVLLVVKATL